jgi:L-threonylcarbamoyladenylate synthase
MEAAARLIKAGRVIVCPTDTGYAFSANALDQRAVARVFHLKGRSFNNPVHIAVGNIEEAGIYAQVNEAARYLAGHYLPGALTMVLPKNEIVPAILVAGLETVGIRIPDNQVILRLIEITGFPLTTTSANISGQATPYTADEVIEHLGDDSDDPALILDQGPLKIRELSTIIDLSGSPPQLIRQGKISWLEVRESLKRFQPPE